MKKKFLSLAALLGLSLLVMGCGSQQEVGWQETEQLIYSNLRDLTVQKEVGEMMTASGISTPRQEIFFAHVNQFNETVKEKEDPYEMQDQWMDKYPDFLGYNCRITAFGLFGDYIDVPADEKFDEDTIFMDLSSLESDPSAVSFAKGDLERFKVLYSTIPTTATKEESVHVKAIQSDWAERGISLRENDSASLITVWLHEQFEKDYLFIGHVGVLFEQDNGLFFVEKLAFQEPYQVSQFSSRKELRQYLMDKYDFSEGQPTAAPIIMENDQFMGDDNQQITK